MKRASFLLAALVLAGLPGTPALALSGDVTNDGLFDLSDALAICRHLSGRLPTLPAPRNGDVNYDGEVDATDLDMVLDAIVGVPLPPQALDVAPDALEFGDAEIGSGLTLDLVAGNSGGAEITIQAIDLEPGTAEAYSIVSAPVLPAPLAPGAGATITIRFAPDLAGAAAGSLVVLSSRGDATVGLTGRGTTGFLSVFPLGINFGEVYAGDLLAREITIRNTGTAEIEVTSIAAGAGTGPDFVIEYAPVTPFTLPPKGQRSFRVAYEPAEAGEDGGTVEILSTAGSASVALQGRGIDPAPAPIP